MAFFHITCLLVTPKQQKKEKKKKKKKEKAKRWRMEKILPSAHVNGTYTRFGRRGSEINTDGW
jgi:hypothetical protein